MAPASLDDDAAGCTDLDDVQARDLNCTHDTPYHRLTVIWVFCILSLRILVHTYNGFFAFSPHPTLLFPLIYLNIYVIQIVYYIDLSLCKKNVAMEGKKQASSGLYFVRITMGKFLKFAMKLTLETPGQ